MKKPRLVDTRKFHSKVSKVEDLFAEMDKSKSWANCPAEALAFENAIRQFQSSLGEILARFTHVVIGFTCCRGGDDYAPRRASARSIWNGMRDWICQATKQTRADFVRKEFVTSVEERVAALKKYHELGRRLKVLLPPNVDADTEVLEQDWKELTSGPQYEIPTKLQEKLGSSIRGITRTFGVCYETVLRWVGENSRQPSGHCCPLKTGTCSHWTSFGASWVPKRNNSGYGWPFAEEPARSWPGPWATAACKVPVIGGRTRRPATGVVPRAVTSGTPAPLPFQRGRTTAAAKKRAKPATSNASLAPCERGSAA